MSTFFIADMHFGHKNCLAYDNRKFSSIKAHDETLIERWNSAVGIDDDVWILGDISWHSAAKTIEILNRLNGTKHLCIGNHDKKLLRNKEVRHLFTEIVDYKEIRLDEKCGIVLCHYPIPCYNNRRQRLHHKLTSHRRKCRHSRLTTRHKAFLYRNSFRAIMKTMPTVRQLTRHSIHI